MLVWGQSQSRTRGAPMSTNKPLDPPAETAAGWQHFVSPIIFLKEYPDRRVIGTERPPGETWGAIFFRDGGLAMDGTGTEHEGG